MSEKFRNKYRIPSARRPHWNYAWSANYFITICTHRKQVFFGEVENGKMHLSEIGRIVQSEWLQTASLRGDMHIHLGAFVVMPNHFHAIITIGVNQFNAEDEDEDDDDGNSEYKNEFRSQSKNLASIVRGFKSAVTSKARMVCSDFAWQTRFHDHIIRNSETYDLIERYILNNPVNWRDDKFYTP